MPNDFIDMRDNTRLERHPNRRLVLERTHQDEVSDAAISSSRKSPGRLKSAIVEVRRTLRARDQFLESTDQRADYLATLVEQSARGLDGGHRNRGTRALEPGNSPLDVSPPGNLPFDFAEYRGEIAKSIRQVRQTDGIALEGNGQEVGHVTDMLLGPES